MTRQDDGHRLEGTVVVPLEVLPCRIEYSVVVDGRWSPMTAEVTVTAPGQFRTINLQLDGGQHWLLGGVAAPELEGCGDVDLGWTPATNTVPIRRLALGVGETTVVVAAWVRFPELDVVRSEQHYSRLAENRWRYRSGDYDFELVTDTASGLVLEYGDDLWRAVATDG